MSAKDEKPFDWEAAIEDAAEDQRKAARPERLRDPEREQLIRQAVADLVVAKYGTYLARLRKLADDLEALKPPESNPLTEWLKRDRAGLAERERRKAERKRKP